MAGQRTMGTSLTLTKAGSEQEDLVLKHLTSIGEQTNERSEIETTALDSPNGAKEFIGGDIDAGSLEVSANNCFDGQVEKLSELFNSGEIREWTETYPSGATLTFNAYVSALTFGEAATGETLATANFTLRLTGLPVYDESPEDSEAA